MRCVVRVSATSHELRIPAHLFGRDDACAMQRLLEVWRQINVEDFHVQRESALGLLLLERAPSCKTPSARGVCVLPERD